MELFSLIKMSAYGMNASGYALLRLAKGLIFFCNHQ